MNFTDRQNNTNGSNNSNPVDRIGNSIYIDHIALEEASKSMTPRKGFAGDRGNHIRTKSNKRKIAVNKTIKTKNPAVKIDHLVCDRRIGSAEILRKLDIHKFIFTRRKMICGYLR
jgi:hypothetical protein